MKHAYLIIAHNEPHILECLLKLIDYEDNDIYLHVDKKWIDFDQEYFKSCVIKSKLYFADRLDVRWGTYKQIECELLLFDTASKNGKYDYYHLLSGIDLPLKSQKEIHEFFKQNQGKEFIHFDTFSDPGELAKERIKYYHFFTSKFNEEGFVSKVYSALHFRLVKLQKNLNVNRNKDVKIRKGANWLSITDDLVRYILSNREFIEKTFKYSYCADELFIQTLVFNSDFYNKLYLKKENYYRSILRFIDWDRGTPYIFEINDYDQLINSGYFFARKFSTQNGTELVDKIYEYVKEL